MNEQAKHFIAICSRMEQESKGVRLAIERSADSTFIGWSDFFNWDPEYRSVGIGYCLNDKA